MSQVSEWVSDYLKLFFCFLASGTVTGNLACVHLFRHFLHQVSLSHACMDDAYMYTVTRRNFSLQEMTLQIQAGLPVSILVFRQCQHAWTCISVKWLICMKFRPVLVLVVLGLAQLARFAVRRYRGFDFDTAGSGWHSRSTWKILKFNHVYNGSPSFFEINILKYSRLSAGSAGKLRELGHGYHRARSVHYPS